jgi:hypothetical protein
VIFQVGERRRRVAHLLEEDFLYWLSYLLNICISFYDKEVLLGFLPLEGFPG